MVLMALQVWDDTVAAKAQQDACQCKQAASSQEFHRTTEFGILAENRYTSERNVFLMNCKCMCIFELGLLCFR